MTTTKSLFSPKLLLSRYFSTALERETNQCPSLRLYGSKALSSAKSQKQIPPFYSARSCLPWERQTVRMELVVKCRALYVGHRLPRISDTEPLHLNKKVPNRKAQVKLQILCGRLANIDRKPKV